MLPDNLEKFKFGGNKDGKKVENLLDRYESKDMEVIKEQNESVKNSELASQLNKVKMEKPKNEAHVEDKGKEEQEKEGSDIKGEGVISRKSKSKSKLKEKVLPIKETSQPEEEEYDYYDEEEEAD